MSIAFDVFIEAFLNKVTSYDYVDMDDSIFAAQTDRFLFGACAEFENIFRRRTGLSFFDRDMDNRCFNWNIGEYDVTKTVTVAGDYISMDEVVDIVTEGMLIRWLKSFLFYGDSLDLGNFLATKDFSPYSPSNFLGQLRGLYDATQKRYTHLINEFSYNHGNLTNLYL